MSKFLILLSIILGVCATSNGKQIEGCPNPGPKGIVLNQTLNLSSPTPHQRVAIMVHLILPPGDLGLKPHTHPGPVTGYVIEGELLQQVKNGPQTIVKAGQTFFEKEGDVHVWIANASNDTTTRVLATVWARPGEELTTYIDLGYERESREEAIKLAMSKVKS